MLLSAIKRKRRRRNNGNNGNVGNQTIYTQRAWSLKGEAYTESEAVGGYATSVNADGTIVVNAGRNASNAPFLNVGRWNNTSFSWNYTKINLTAQDGEIVTSISDDGNVIAVGFEGVGYSSNTNVIVYAWNSSSWSQRGSAITTRSYHCSIDISGDGSVLAIGEPFADISRRVRVFKWAASSWGAYGNIITVAGAGSNHFGWKVSLNGSGDTVAVGTQAVDTGVDIYRLSGGTWSQLGNRLQYETGSDGWYGCDAVKLDSSGNFVAIAGYLGQNTTTTTTGTVRVFRWIGSTWTKVGNDISQSGNYSNNEPDVSLSMDGTASRIIVSTRQLASGGGDRSIKVYDWNGTGWELSATVTHGVTDSNNGFNPKLSRDGQTMTFGAPNTKVSAVYTTNSIWSQLGLDIDGNAGDYIGNSISMNSAGNRVAIGASYSDNSGVDRGYTQIHEYNSSTQAWTRLGQNIIGEFARDESGWSVSMNTTGNRVAIGARLNDGNGTNSGHTRIYEYNASTQLWVQLGQDINGEASNDESGYSVSMNAAGNRVAIGAPYNDGTGNNSGHVRIYEYNASTQLWVQLGQDINGEAANDTSSVSVSINAVGDRVAIGAPSNVANNGDLTGHVRIYEYNSSTQVWAQLGVDVDGAGGANSSFGAKVYMNAAGDRFVVGIPNAPMASDTNNFGAVRAYAWNGSSWARLGQDISGIASQDRFGDSIGINAAGTRIIIGAGQLSQANGKTRVYEYKESTQLWTQIGQSINAENLTMYAGGSVSINSIGDKIAIGTPYNDGNGFVSGHVRVYRLT